MYIQFRLPLQNKGWARHILLESVQSWCLRNDTTYTHKTVKNHLRVCLADEDLYVTFSMTWVPPMHKDWTQYRVLIDLNNRQDTRESV